MRSIFFTLLLVFTVHAAVVAQVTGTWKTIDDETGNAKSYVEITIDQNGVLQGRVMKLLQLPESTVCAKCSGDQKNKPIVGMFVLTQMQLKDGYYQGGSILDPNNGKSYKCKLWLKAGDNNTLEVRGSVGPFYRTQTWIRVQ